MKSFVFFLIFSSICTFSFAQTSEPTLNVRLSFLLFPFSPLLSLEVRTFGNLTLQGETNFVHTHGLNLKYYFKNRMENDYAFVGTAFVKNKLLRVDEKSTTLLYAGYGYANRFGKSWVFDGRIGFGPTINADSNGVYPVIKLGIGKIF